MGHISSWSAPQVASSQEYGLHPLASDVTLHLPSLVALDYYCHMNWALLRACATTLHLRICIRLMSRFELVICPQYGVPDCLLASHFYLRVSHVVLLSTARDLFRECVAACTRTTVQITAAKHDGKTSDLRCKRIDAHHRLRRSGCVYNAAYT